MTVPQNLAAAPPSTEGVADIVVAGAGVVGLALAIALAREGFAVASIGSLPGGQTGRTIALLDGSVRLLSALGVWPRLAAAAAPLRTMRIVDATPSLFRGPPVDFVASAIGLEAFGYNVENTVLVEALAAVAAQTPGLARIDGWLTGHAIERERAITILKDGTRVASRLIVAADGARSVLRDGAGIAAREHVYPQEALTVILAHRAPHGDVSTEFHTRQGPFTLVPMMDDADGRHRSSLVWVMRPAEAERRAALGPTTLAGEIERQSRGLLGAMTLAGQVGRFPIRRLMADRLVGPRLALAGEAAHAMPPIGAQGLNLSLRDAGTLVDLLADARAAREDPGSPRVLDRYERSRIGDIALRGAGVHALNAALLSAAFPTDILRGLGLRLIGAVRPLREAVMRQGLRPTHAVPRLMRGSAGDPIAMGELIIP